MLMAPGPLGANETIIFGDRMSLGESMVAKALPAFTYRNVASSIPAQLTNAKVRVGIVVNPMPRLMRKNGMRGTSRSENR